jgi:hypothetical protein
LYRLELDLLAFSARWLFSTDSKVLEVETVDCKKRQFLDKETNVRIYKKTCVLAASKLFDIYF